MNDLSQVATTGNTVVYASHRAFAADQDFLADLLVYAKHINFAQERIILLCGLFKALLTRRIYGKFCSDSGG